MIYAGANTSVNKVKLPAIYRNKMVVKNLNGSVLDLGCGKYTDHIERYVSEIGGFWSGYDPYNQPEFLNLHVMSNSELFGVNTIIISNVLNVIPDMVERVKLVNIGAKCMRNNSKIFISIYEGNGSGVGCETKKECWQNNCKLDFYLEELQKYFHDYTVYKKYGVIVIENK